MPTQTSRQAKPEPTFTTRSDHARQAARGAALSRCGATYQASPLDLFWTAVGQSVAKAEYSYRQAALGHDSLAHRRQPVVAVTAVCQAAARSCTAAIRCTLWPPRPDRLMSSERLWPLSDHAARPAASAPLSSAVRHSGQSLRSCPRHITALGLPAWQGWSVRTARLRYAQAPRVTSPVLRRCQSVRYAQIDVTTLRRAIDSAFVQQRSRAGHLAHRTAPRAAAGSPTPLLLSFVIRWPQSVGKAGTPCQATTPRLAYASCWTATLGSCGTRPLRPHASLLHKAALPSVPGSHCAKAPFGAGHRYAPCG